MIAWSSCYWNEYFEVCGSGLLELDCFGFYVEAGRQKIIHLPVFFVKNDFMRKKLGDVLNYSKYIFGSTPLFEF
jgi:hypothetical protein